MNGANLLQETSAWMDTVDLALCLFIYEVCNDCQFEFASGSDFVNFMNLKPTSRPSPSVRKKTCVSVIWFWPYPGQSDRTNAGNFGRKSS